MCRASILLFVFACPQPSWSRLPGGPNHMPPVPLPPTAASAATTGLILPSAAAPKQWPQLTGRVGSPRPPKIAGTPIPALSHLSPAPELPHAPHTCASWGPAARPPPLYHLPHLASCRSGGSSNSCPLQQEPHCRSAPSSPGSPARRASTTAAAWRRRQAWVGILLWEAGLDHWVPAPREPKDWAPAAQGPRQPILPSRGPPYGPRGSVRLLWWIRPWCLP